MRGVCWPTETSETLRVWKGCKRIGGMDRAMEKGNLVG